MSKRFMQVKQDTKHEKKYRGKVLELENEEKTRDILKWTG